MFNGLVWVSQELLTSWDFNVQQYLEFQQNHGEIQKKNIIFDGSERGQKRMVRLFRADRKASVSQITTHLQLW